MTTQHPQRTPIPSIFQPNQPFHTQYPQEAGFQQHENFNQPQPLKMPSQPSNFMSYSSSSVYDDGKYSQYSTADYGFQEQQQFPSLNSGPINYPSSNPPKYPPNILNGISAGRAPDTGSAIRQGGVKGWEGHGEWNASFAPPNSGMAPDHRSDPNQSTPSKAFQIMSSNPESSVQTMPTQPAQLSATQPLQNSSYYSCPSCGSLAVRVFDTITRDAICSNGHSWHMINNRKTPLEARQ